MKRSHVGQFSINDTEHCWSSCPNYDNHDEKTDPAFQTTKTSSVGFLTVPLQVIEVSGSRHDSPRCFCR